MMNLLLKLVTSVLRSEKHPRHASREIARLNAFRVKNSSFICDDLESLFSFVQRGFKAFYLTHELEKPTKLVVWGELKCHERQNREN